MKLTDQNIQTEHLMAYYVPRFYISYNFMTHNVPPKIDNYIFHIAFNYLSTSSVDIALQFKNSPTALSEFISNCAFAFALNYSSVG